MFKNISDNSKELGLAERIQPGTTEIYTPQGIPSGSVVPDYTHTQTRPTIEFSSSEQRKKDTAIRHLLATTSEERRLLFESFQKKYEDEIYHYITDLMLWVATTEHFQDKMMSLADYDFRIQEEQKKLKAMDDKLPVESYFRHGSDDTVKCGHLFIIKTTEWDEAQQIYAVEVLSGIQWLMQEKEKLMSSAATQKKEVKVENPIIPPPEENTFEKAFETLIVTHLKLKDKGTNVVIGNKSWNKSRLMVALMNVLNYRGTLPTNDIASFASMIAPVIGVCADNLRKNISRCLQDIKPYGVNLKDLNEGYIKNNPPEDGKGITTRQFRNHWEGLYELIDSFISTKEELKILRGEGAMKSARTLCAY